MGSDRFSELSDMEAQSRQQDDDDDLEPETESKSEPTTSEPEPESQPDATGDIHETAFNYDEAKQSPIYARPSTWDEYDDGPGTRHRTVAQEARRTECLEARAA
jgi:hypothetical protein